MKFMAFFPWHDSSIAAFDGQKIRYLKTERDTGIKHDSFFNGWPPNPPIGSNEERKITVCKQKILEACEKWNFTPDAIAFCGISHCKDENTLWEQRSPIFGLSVPTFCLDHHFAHALSCWPVCDRVNYGVVVDGVGDHRVTHKIIKNPQNINQSEVVFYSKQPSLAGMLKSIGVSMGLSGMTIDYAGKIMGAQSYGKAKQVDFAETLSLLDVVSSTIPENKKFGDVEYNDWLATMHKVGTDRIFELFKKTCPSPNIVSFSGGCAQNTVLNSELYNYYNGSLFIPPHCYDGGLTLGCIEFLRQYYKQDPLPKTNFPYWQDDVVDENPTNQTIDLIVDALCENKIVGWFQGRGEIGPRALGNRSILMNPAIPDGKDKLNNQVKKREHWRPYAPSIIEEDCSEWFECEKSEYMLRTIKAKKPDRVPAVVHIDNTSRIQTVTRKSNEVFYKLLCKFKERTGIPMLLNTSLNTGGKPIFSTKSQCVEMIETTEIDMVCYGDSILTKHKHL